MCEDCNVSYTPETADEAVANGIGWLNTNGPANWRELVNLSILDVDSPTRCVLGQVFRNMAENPDYTFGDGWSVSPRLFNSGYDYAVITFLGGGYNNSNTGPLGFSEWDGADIDGTTMTDAWVRALAA
jgi:hypothetical protein